MQRVPAVVLCHQRMPCVFRDVERITIIVNGGKTVLMTAVVGSIWQKPLLVEAC